MMTKDELYDKIITLVPAEYIDGLDFRASLSAHLSEYLKLVKEIDGIDDSLVRYIEHVCNVIREILRSQYKGLHSQAFVKLSYLLSGTDKYEALKNFSIITELEPKSCLYRARAQQDYVKFTHRDMFHIPFDKRGWVKTQRYSFPGYPCLYVGESIYACWEEMHRIDFDLCMFSRIENTRSVRLLDMRIPTKEDYKKNEAAVLRRFPLLIACMMVVKNMNDVFKPEYIIPQLLTEWVITNNAKSKKDCNDIIYGIRYTSSLKTNEFEFPETKLDNIAIFPIDSLGGRNNYCPILAETFNITDPTCNEYERLKYGSAISWEEIDLDDDVKKEKNYEGSDFFRLEMCLKDLTKFPLNKISAK